MAADLAVDLGSARTRLVVRRRGVVLDIPTVVATAERSGGRTVVAIGDEAHEMIGRAPARTRVVRPVRGGVVADFEATERLLRTLLDRIGATGLRRPRILVAIPEGTSEVGRRAVQESARAAGSGSVLLVASPLAAAIGAGLPVRDPVASMVVDVGAGRTHVAVISLGGLVVSHSVAAAGDALDDAIMTWLRDDRNLLIGERTAETLKIEMGSLIPEVNPDHRLQIRGRDVVNGRPQGLDVRGTELATALAPVVEPIRRAVLDTLAQTPPELCADLVDRGILTCGGTSRLRGLDAVVSHDTGLAALQAEDPALCVAHGTLALLDNPDLLERVVGTQ